MTISRVVAQEAKFQNKRRGVRVNSRVPVELVWKGEGDQTRLDVHTRVVGPYGCMAVIPKEFGVEQQLEITNRANLRSNPGVIVWKGKQRVEGWEYGIELIEPEMDFWGLEL
ncbi:MAG: hypothetical protein WAM91_10285 [Candidatus Acidiferrales bacterium]